MGRMHAMLAACAAGIALSAQTALAAATFAPAAQLDYALGFQQSGSLKAGPDGRLYGTSTYTYYGDGCFSYPYVVGCGTVFALTPPGPGHPTWRQAVLYTFQGKTDGSGRSSEVLFGRDGSAFGTTAAGGHSGAGVVFMLTRPASPGAAWTETVLHSFNGTTDGAHPTAELVRDAEGRLYGTAPSGGASQAGTVFRLTPPIIGRSEWAFAVLHRFAGADGANPVGGVILRVVDGVVTLFGTTRKGGPNDKGTVFRLTAPGPGRSAWTHTILHGFTGGADGALPSAALIADRSLTLFGTTQFGGVKIPPYSDGESIIAGYPDGAGVVFKLAPPSTTGGPWSESVLHTFGGFEDGAAPVGKLYESAGGVLFGVTVSGGYAADPFNFCGNCGTVFQLTPRDYGGHLVPWRKDSIHLFRLAFDGGFPPVGLAPLKGPGGQITLFGLTDGGVLYTVTP